MFFLSMVFDVFWIPNLNPSPYLNRQDLRDLENMAIQVGGLKLGYIVENSCNFDDFWRNMM